ncbi:MAG: PilZ domain-containing protein [Bryobacterales bacterium]|nr:PilZ domain-containing protein [Bryobacterales bacterium]
MINRLAMRRFERKKVTTRAILGFNDHTGTAQVVRARVVDASAGGACLETDVPVETRSFVQLRVDDPSFTGAASVRYCVRKKLRYAIGIEFTCGSEWPAKHLVQASDPAP